MGRRWFVALVAVSVTILAGCGGNRADDGRFRVALVTPGPVSDGGWNASAFAGLGRIASDLGAVTAHIEASSPAQFEESFRDFASRRFELVFGHGFELQDAALAVGADYPGCAFVITSGSAVAPNVAGLVFRLEEAAYLAGVLAGHVSRSGVAGMVGGMEIPPVRLVFEGFARGFDAARPGGEVKEVYLGSWEDVAGARQAALSLVDQGADLLIQNADAAGLGVFQACRERGVLAMGTNGDQSAVAPDVVLASAAMDIPEAMVRVARDVRQGTFVGHIYVFDLASGVVSLIVNPALSARVSATARDAVTAAAAAVENGDVRLEHFGG